MNEEKEIRPLRFLITSTDSPEAAINNIAIPAIGDKYLISEKTVMPGERENEWLVEVKFRRIEE